MKVTKIKTLLFANVLILTGCAGATHSNMIPLEYLVPGHTGRVIGSIAITTEGEGMNSLPNNGIQFRKKGSEKVGMFYIKHDPDMMMGGRAEFTEGNLLYTTFDVNLDAGDYEIVDVDFWSYAPVEREITAKKQFSIPFHVTPGETTYLGQFLVNGLTAENLFGIAIPAGGSFLQSNKMARDLNAIDSKTHNIVKADVHPYRFTKDAQPYIYISDLLKGAPRLH